MRRLIQAVVAGILLTGTPASAGQKKSPDDLSAALQDISRIAKEANNWRSLRCTPDKRYVCGDTCEAAPAATYTEVSREGEGLHGVVNRCDDKGCDRYEAMFVTAGLYTSIQMSAARGYLMKIEGNRSFIEIATSGLQVHYAAGTCRGIE